MRYGIEIWNGNLRLVDLRTGRVKSTLTSNAVAFASDGEHLVVVDSQGRASRFDAATGAPKGSVGGSGVVGCSISNGLIVLVHEGGKAIRYDARTGDLKAS
jgi:sugar lactone lactonase YvrE